MTTRQFVRKYRHRITDIMRSLGATGRMNDSERELWVMNNEKLYRYAISEGMDP